MPPAQREPWPGIARGTPDFRRSLVAMLSAGFATFALLYCAQPLLPEFAREFRLGAATASLALSLTTAALGITMLVVSVISESVGRRPLMLASLFLAAALTIACAFAPSWPALLVLRTLSGVAFAGLPALAMAYLGEEMRLDALGPAMGLYVAGTGLGGMAGRLLTAWLTDLASWRVAVGLVGALGLAAALITWRTLPRSRRFVRATSDPRARLAAFGEHLRDGTLLRLFAVGFAVLGTAAAVYNYVVFRLLAPPYLLSHTAVGLIFVLYLAGIASSSSTGHLLGRIGAPTLLRVSLGVMIAGMIVTLARPLPLIVLGVALVTIGFFAAHAVAGGWVTQHAHRSRAQGTALYLCSYYLGSSVVGSAGGLFWDGAGWGGVVAFTSVLLVGTLGLARGLPARAMS